MMGFFLGLGHAKLVRLPAVAQEDEDFEWKKLFGTRRHDHKEGELSILSANRSSLGVCFG